MGLHTAVATMNTNYRVIKLTNEAVLKLLIKIRPKKVRRKEHFSIDCHKTKIKTITRPIR